MPDEKSIGTQLGAGCIEGFTKMIQEVSIWRSHEIATMYDSNVRRYATWRRTLPGSCRAERLYAEWQILRTMYPNDPPPKDLIEQLVAYHGSNIDLWPTGIPDAIKSEAKARQIAASLCPSFNDLAAKERLFARISGQPK
jgi:hypothetical protein